MRDLFAHDPQRFARFSLRVGDILFDYSKNRITDQTLPLLCGLARQAHLEECIAALPGAIGVGSAVLVKASRLLRLERVVDAILTLPASRTAPEPGAPGVPDDGGRR